MKAEAITLSESSRFIELEKTIERGKKTFVEVGSALAEIRDSKLYRSDFDTFEEYCKEKWGWTRRYSDNLIAAAGVVKSLPNENNCSQIKTESQARELAKVEPTKRESVLEKAVAAAESEQRPLAARDIKEAAAPLGDFPDPEAPDFQPPTPDDKWNAAFGGAVPVIKRDLTDEESALEALAMGVRDNADLVMNEIRDLDEAALEEIDTNLTEFRRAIRLVIHQRVNLIAP